MKKLLAIAGLVLLFVMAGCNSAHGLVSAHGRLVIAGGPAPGAARPEPKVQIRLEAASATARTAVVTTDSMGRFSLRLRPGTYRVVIPGPGAKAFGDGRPLQPLPREIRVESSKSNEFELVISVM